MSQPPTPYQRQYNFTSFQTSNPTTPLPGNKVDQEFNAVLTAIYDTINRLSEIQRDDGKVRDEALNLDTLGYAVSDYVKTSVMLEINMAKNAQIAAVNDTGTTNVASVNAAGTAGVASINAALTSANATTALNAASAASTSAFLAEGYKNNANSYQNLALGYKNEAMNFANNANTYKAEAFVSAQNALVAKNSAVIFSDNAANEAAAANSSATDAENSKMAALDAKAQAQAAAAAATSIVANAAASIVADVQPYIDQASASATDAATSAANAAGSASSAASSATSALAYRNDASNYSFDAQGYKNAAATSATNAANSATNASSAASQAGTASNAADSAKNAAQTAATAAANYASSASGDATAAATSASDAANSATAAATSEGNAASSASSAAGSATSASNSAAAAVASETNASGYASNASSYASSASASASSAASSAASFSLAIGTVTTGSVGSSAAASVSGTAPSYTLDLTIPTGADGANGTPLNMRGSWSYGTTYAPGDVTVYSNQAYAAINAIGYSSVDPATDTTNWVLLTIVGPAGTPGTNGTDGQSLTVMGTWTYGNTYNPGQITVDPTNSLPYLCLASHYSVTFPVYDATNWVQLNIATAVKSIYSTGTVGAFTETVNVSDVSGGTAGEVSVNSTANPYPVKLTSTGVQFNDGTVQGTAFNPSVYAKVYSQAFTGTPTVPALDSADNSLKIANTGFVKAQGYLVASDISGKANTASPTFTGKVTTAASAAGGAGFRIPSGSAPTTPVAGDIWVASSALWLSNGTTSYQLAALNLANTWTTRQTHAPTATNATLNLFGSADPSTLTTGGDIWFNGTTGKLKYTYSSAAQTVASESWVTGLGYVTSSSLASYAALAGATFTGKVVTVASSTANAGLNLPSGTAPTTPTAGDLWYDGTRLVFRNSVANLNIASSGTSTTYSVGVKQTFNHNAANGASLSVGATAIDVTTPAAGDVYHNSSTGVNQIVGYTNSMRSAMTATRAFAAVTSMATTPVISSNFNVSSITDNGVGDITLNFTNAMADAVYAVVGSAGNGTNSTTSVVQNTTTARTTSACRILVSQANAAFDPSFVSVAIFR